ncbi:MAG: NAD(P)-binding protein [Bradyrhizobium sp.]|nr:NAD(P)-binding protein [Bradyrhizobium sp.]
MKIAIIGASGNVGSRVAAELSSRGHSITAIARDASKIAKIQGVTAVSQDITDVKALAEVLKGHDAVFSAVKFLGSDPDQLIAAVRAAGVRRYLVSGGAGSLYVSPGVRLIDTPDFPEEYKGETAAGCVFLDKLREVKDLEWTFLSPAYNFTPGERTGKFRLGKDDLLVDANGESKLSMEDFAIALADEIENPKNIRARFTVGY